MEKRDISEAELEIMQALWRRKEAVTAQSVAEALEKKAWKYSTIATLLGRLVEKGAVTYEKRGRFYYYTPLLGEREYRQAQTKKLVARLYGGSVKNLVVSLFENNTLTEQEIAEIKRKFEL